VAVALTDGAPVGVDVERIVDLDVDQLAPYVVAPEERAATGGVKLFLALWARKEAVLKGTGDGLSVPMCDIVTFPVGNDARVSHYPGRPGLEVVVRDLAPRAGYVSAVAVLTEGDIDVVTRDGDSLLRHPHR
jgi:4'-phosphopantetheinyl transferase